jgi:ComF family protein
MIKMFSALESWFLPYTCAVCNLPSGKQRDLCATCHDDLPWLKTACQRCSQPFEAITETICGDCLKYPPSYDRCIALFHYQLPVDQFIIRLKFQRKLLYSKLLGELLLTQVLPLYVKEKPNLILPVPLHKMRLRERGFNQALEIARPIAKHMKIPMGITLVRRVRHTEAQSLIPADQRYKNVKNSFVVTENLAGKYIVIIDDVMTTGHTVNELSKTLRKAGATKIDVWCCARAGRIKNS